MAARLKERYKTDVFPALQEKFHYNNVMEVPKLEKITLNIGLGDCKDNPKLLEMAVKEMAIIAGQAPVITKSRKSIANFKVRSGMSVGCKVTLRGDRMYEFADKFFNIALPRVRDFKGVSVDNQVCQLGKKRRKTMISATKTGYRYTSVVASPDGINS